MAIVRKEIRELSSSELANFLIALEQLKLRQTGSNFKKYNYVQLARVHSLDCPHLSWESLGTATLKSKTFLSWHRKYIYLFERALQDAYWEKKNYSSEEQANAQSIFLPYWDWTKKPSGGNLIPPIFSSEPLLKNNIFNASLSPSSLPVAFPTVTGTIIRIPSTEIQNWDDYACLLQTKVNVIKNNTSFDAFSGIVTSSSPAPLGILTPHDNIHNAAVGGWMFYTKSAAYDPIFWMHHANVDRLWMNWQGSPPYSNRLPSVTGTSLYSVQSGGSQSINTVLTNVMLGGKLHVRIQDINGSYDYTYLETNENALVCESQRSMKNALVCESRRSMNNAPVQIAKPTIKNTVCIIILTGTNEIDESMRIDIYFNAFESKSLNRDMKNYAGSIDIFGGHDKSKSGHQMGMLLEGSLRSARFAIIDAAYEMFSRGGRPPEKVDLLGYTSDGTPVPLDKFKIEYSFHKVVISPPVTPTITVSAPIVITREPLDPLYDVASGDADFSMLKEAIDFASFGEKGVDDLVRILRREKDWTLFAPNNSAFTKIKSTIVRLTQDRRNEANRRAVRMILMNHMVRGNYTIQQLKTMSGKMLPTLGNKPLVITTQGTELQVNDIKVIENDIVATNGLIHPIESII
jgi:uncharacterized surface protein with fasciclin (FAS1) repeats